MKSYFIYVTFGSLKEAKRLGAQLVKNKFKNVHLIANSNNTGFAVANNQAIKQAKGKYILFRAMKVINITEDKQWRAN